MSHRTVRGLLGAALVSASLLVGAGFAQASLSPSQLQATTDSYLFQNSLSSFMSIRSGHPYADQLDWSTDVCSHVPDRPLGYDFSNPCIRHDFGYRNYKKQGRFNATTKKSIDDNFRNDMYSVCGSSKLCRGTADVYYWGVRKLGS
ncbi:phospholipase [Kutzneria viridogrisea]|uniref:Secreted protein n=2 Tax=Kutzneria TaxID=43356 RepID=W5WH50_9PSEU|nr:phospholipase [Kutzneria albida]AHI00529.1 hypothetical protein KALB_7171 [Kutzneria albida DSM 43870]MBA8925708.1 hypothetical protein [Kutzneria viridogrisea]